MWGLSEVALVGRVGARAHAFLAAGWSLEGDVSWKEPGLEEGELQTCEARRDVGRTNVLQRFPLDSSDQPNGAVCGPPGGSTTMIFFSSTHCGNGWTDRNHIWMDT